MVHWRAAARREAEVHDDQIAAGPKRSGEVARVADAIGEMVPHVHNEDAVDAVSSQARGGTGGADRAQVGELLAASALVQVAHLPAATRVE